jgi:neutral ceramidase
VSATSLRAGFAKVEISGSAIGAELQGYPNRVGGALSINDPLFVRALVLERGEDRVAVCSVDLMAVNEDVVAAARARIAREVGIPSEGVFVSATHTHSAPFDDDERCWSDGLDASIAEAVSQGSQRLAEARLGAGWGMLHGHSINRRRLENPVDPAVFVLRIDDGEGAPLGIYYGYACHPVVLGYDSLLVSADWPGSSSRILESQLGPETVAVFGQGASGDVNPLTDGMRRSMAEARTVQTLVAGSGPTYYGGVDGEIDAFHVGDRMGGTVAEIEPLGRAVAQEVLNVHRGIATEDVSGLWTRQIAIAQTGTSTPDRDDDAGSGDGSRPQPPHSWYADGNTHSAPRADADVPLELMLLGIDGPDVVLVGQPGEVFAETGAALRQALRAAGVRHPYVVGYANGWRGYLTPGEAYPDGGYEVNWARWVGLSETLQDDVRVAVLDAVASDVSSSR